MKAIGSIPVLLFFIALAGFRSQRDESVAEGIKTILIEIEAIKERAPREEQSAFDTAIDSLARLRDHESWRMINSPVAIASLQNTKWKMSPDANGFRQTISFSSSSGLWFRTPGTLPMSFNWQIESDRLRLSYSSSYKDPFHYQIVDRTFQYRLEGKKLTMIRGEDSLEWFADTDPK